MKSISRLLGVNVGELFHIYGNPIEWGYMVKDDDFLYCKKDDDNDWRVCDDRLVILLLQEYYTIVRQPKISEKDRHLLNYYYCCGYRWFARNESGKLYGYKNEPKRVCGDSVDCGYWYGIDGDGIVISQTHYDFLSNLKWINEPLHWDRVH